jgi:hypothetical protein
MQVHTYFILSACNTIGIGKRLCRIYLQYKEQSTSLQRWKRNVLSLVNYLDRYSMIKGAEGFHTKHAGSPWSDDGSVY